VVLLVGLPLQGEPEKPSDDVDLQLQLARSEHFYLELDPGEHSLCLRLAGVALRTYPLLAAEIGMPRIAFVPRRAAASFTGKLLPPARVDPPRPEILLEILPPPADADSTTPPLQLPPRLDEMPVPWTYRLHFGADLTVVVTSSREIEQHRLPAALGTLSDKLHEVTQAFMTKDPVVRLTLTRDDAEHLYRALPPETGLLVLRH
jgi:hypothetical protein